MTGTAALDNLIFTLTQVAKVCPPGELLGIVASTDAARAARAEVTEED